MADDLTLERLKSRLHYSPETGQFTRLVSRGTGRAGLITAAVDSNGHIQIRVDKKRYRAHRLAWFYMTGCWPAAQIDHINGIRADNRWENLREATNTQNVINGKLRDDNPTGFKGVTLDSEGRRKWRARITVDGKQRFLGYFDTPEAAAEAYKAAAVAAFGQFARFS
jgi:hypothetical protein